MLFESMIIAGIGGFFGTCGRYLTGVAAKKIFKSSYPFGTFCANFIGCFIIGLLFGLWNSHEMDTTMKVLLISGFCGGYTTFSSFSHDMYSLIQKGKYVQFATYLITSVGFGLLMVWAGMSITGR